MLGAFALAFVQASSGPIAITDGLLITGISRAGRRPTPDDAIGDLLASGNWHPPTVGEEVRFHDRRVMWRAVKVGKDGTFGDLGSGYLYATIDEPQAVDVVMNAKGDSIAYINGVPRAGDPYENGYLNLPVHLKAGRNELLFTVGRGSLGATFTPVAKPVWLQTQDATLPDLLTDSKAPLFASIIGLNATPAFTKNLTVKVITDSKATWTGSADSIPPYSARKLVCRIPVPKDLAPGKLPVEVQLLDSGKVVDTVTLEVQVKKPLELQRRTFVSEVDGSVQYYAAYPASVPSPTNTLVLTLHGAGVEAYGQAAAYTQKSWATLAAPTNRRPYGFDWEGIGRLDALEVLNLAKAQFPHDPNRVDLTGHSMGGHGTWAIGTMYPNLFASIGPSAGWISFASYGGGWKPTESTPALDLLKRSMNVGDTLGRVDNTLSEKVYILHGDVDDNVPVQQARTMKAKLEEIHHPNLQYHEQPGANHWWGNQCVDWPPLFDMIKGSTLHPDANHVDFTTQNPAVADTDRWVKVQEQVVPLAPSHLVADRMPSGEIHATTSNVAEFTLEGLSQGENVVIDSQSLTPLEGGSESFQKIGDRWETTDSSSKESRGGTFKQVFNHRFAFIVGTTGTPEETEWALTRAEYSAETMMYRGNGVVEVVLDKDYSPRKFRGRNLILFGNRQTNSAWTQLLGSCPIDFSENRCNYQLGSSTDSNLSGLVVFPKPGESDTLVGAVTGTGLQGLKMTDRLPLFVSGVDYPDWIVFGPNTPESVVADGFFDNRWKFDKSQSAQAVGR